MPLNLHAINRILAGLIVAMLMGTASIQAAEDQADVVNVRFNALRPPDGSDNWFEMDVEIEARPATDTSGRVTGRMRVTAMVAYERPAPGNTRRWEFFRANGELVGLVSGRTHVRFYLPPEIVKRDALSGALGYWEVTLTGDSLAADKPIGSKSSALNNAEVYRGFHDKIASEASANDGVMQLQYMTPFADAYPRATPTYVRRDAWR